MKVRGTIVEDVKTADKSVIVEFHGDKEKQHFELHCAENQFGLGEIPNQCKS